MGEKVKIEPGMRVEIHTKDGGIHLGTISNIEKEPKVTPYAFSWEEVEEKGWGARRWEAAVAAMQGLLTHKQMTVEDIAEYSFRLADAMVKKFKEGER